MNEEKHTNLKNKNTMEEIFIEATKLRPRSERIIDASLVTIDIPLFIKKIKSEKLWKKNDRNSMTIFKTNDMRIVLIALHKNAEIFTHTAKGLISVQVLKGELKFKTNEQSAKLKKGHLLTLKGGIPHGIKASKMTVFLLTLISARDDMHQNYLSETMIEQQKVNGKKVASEKL